MITASVGNAGVNGCADVRLVQSLLNDRSEDPTSPLAVDGVCGPITVACIRHFQARTLGFCRQDGLIAPGDATMRALAPVTLHAPAAIPAEPLPAAIVAAAQAAQRACGVPACISLAQWILESGRGAHMPPDSNNPFGIKATPNQPHVYARTREVVDGKSLFIEARFRKFGSVGEAFAAHARLLADFPPYRPAMAQAGNPDAFAEKLTGVYATDPQYGAALIAIMRGANLYSYDVAA
jgi:peptidoglycan hydrolase-like protein with peptidoglycan-binding domain